ncbi:unnamed protein product [Diatraea saccharalis]|uniref:Major facilitator superfamily (MFS) profile domain-containing protein n=1 Tax=Diatraea saccharalis TaxID=40085 RepID=A0A9N9RAK4_9NEOP|nr:unnamed protein product [Diatraea saccharalis]
MDRGKLYQILTAVASAYGTLLMGLFTVWPSYTVSLLKLENTTILLEPMSSTEVSLLGSLPSLGGMMGTALVAPLIESFGRKRGGLAITLPFVLAWTIVAVSKSSIPILAARFIGGIAGGGNLVFAPMFISEVAEDSFRGTLASATVLFYGVGVLSSYNLGWFFNYTTIIWINLIVSIIGCGLLLIINESPVYLLKKNKEEKARISLAVYRGSSPKSVLVEEAIIKLKHQMCRAFLILISVVALQVFMGMVPMQVYAKQVFMEADSSKADMYSVIFAVVFMGGSFVAGGVVDKAGRRILIILSSAMVAICMGSLGFVLHTRVVPSWVAIVLILLFTFCFTCGAGSIPYILIAEVFNSKVQAFASSVIIECAWFLNFVVLAAFTWLKEIIGIHGIFYIFAVNAIVNATFSFFFVPETKGLSNMQIQDIFSKNRRK